MYIHGKNLTLGYGSNVLMRNLNFEVHKGDYLLIVGENGTGKSTLIKSLIGQVALVEGKIILGDRLSKKDIGYVMQQTYHQDDFPATVFEVVISGCLNKMDFRPFYNKKEKVIALANLKKLGILELKDQLYSNLSGGQKRRVLIARALCASKKLLVLDEPFAGLDDNVSKELYELLEQLNKEITIIMITHDIDACIKYASHILKLGKNNIFFNKEEYIEYFSGDVV